MAKVQKVQQKATVALVLGILSIVLGLLSPLVGIILGIVGIVLAIKKKKVGAIYSQGAFITSIVGIAISVINWIVSTFLYTTGIIPSPF